MYEKTPGLRGALYSDEWKYIIENRHLFLSKRNVWPFIGFALAQANKTTIKGDNLNALRAIKQWGSRLTPGQRQEKLRQWLTPVTDGLWAFRLPTSSSKKKWIIWPVWSRLIQPEWAGFEVSPMKFEIADNDRGFETFRVAGRQYDPGVRLKVFLNNIDDLIKRYGTRSEAAAEHGLDYKSLMHAYRLMGQAEELLRDGKITLPRPPEEVKFLMDVRNMKLPEDFDWLGDINARVDNLKANILPKSPLPDKAAYDKLGRMCREMLREHIIPWEVKLERARHSTK
jgi:hypothetical protein